MEAQDRSTFDYGKSLNSILFNSAFSEIGQDRTSFSTQEML
jgi:hypothetical protein